MKWKTVLKDGSQYTGVLKRRSTRVSIIGGRWFLNGTVTYGGANAEDLLMNGRMVNSASKDTNRKDFDPEANTDRFIVQIPDYLAHGVRAFTIDLQVGDPACEGAVNSAFNADGSPRESYL